MGVRVNEPASVMERREQSHSGTGARGLAGKKGGGAPAEYRLLSGHNQNADEKQVGGLGKCGFGVLWDIGVTVTVANSDQSEERVQGPSSMSGSH